MAMSITHNLMAVNAGRMFKTTNKSKAKSAEKLSSGYRINRAADDAAGLAISEKMRRQIRGLSQGVKNTQEGVSLCQVADGALAEVDEMLHRITELSIKSANGTNSEEDRLAIHQEVTQLLKEIDRIGNTTEFNDIYIFRGTDTVMYGPDGSVITEGSIPFGDFTIADVDLGYHPFGRYSGASELNLQASVHNEDSIANGMSYGLIFGNGGTSKSSIRLQYDNGSGMVSEEIYFSSLTPENYVEGTDSSGKPYWQRDLVYQNDDGVGIKITQKITADDAGTTEKKYNISYSFENTGSVDAAMDFMFHADTAYNNNDICEGYFTSGSRIEESCMYSEPGSIFSAGQTHANLTEGVPDSVSIVDVDRALAFSEKIEFTGDKPDSLSVGYYNSICKWDYYDELSSHLGGNMVGNDLGFSLLWHFDMDAGTSRSVDFNYGIMATESDLNFQGVDIKISQEPLVDHDNERRFWIHSGAEAGDGIWVELQEMNSGVLGIDKLDLTTAQESENAIDPVKGALAQIARLRSTVGAQQNRLEHTIANEDNIVENTTAAESQIRDTDIAEEAVKNANLSILGQAGTSMLTQANQQPNFILQLLQ